MTLDGKVAIVTGAGGAGVAGMAGLGVTYAHALAAHGACVVVADLDHGGAAAVADAIQATGGRAIAVRCDVTAQADRAQAVTAAVEAFGGLDILVNNAGLARGKWNESLTLSQHDWMHIMGVNTVAPVLFAAAARESMRTRGGGVIINQASCGALMDAGAYSVSKAALITATRVMAADLADDNIRVNAIAPGMMTAKLPPEQVARLLARQTVRRMGRPADLVGALICLCSDASSFMNGQTLIVDGGMARVPS